MGRVQWIRHLPAACIDKPSVSEGCNAVSMLIAGRCAMASYEFELAPPPEPGRDRELWLMHAAGLILFEDVGKYARGEIAPGLDPVAREAAEKAINDALYGLMMVIDGVSGRLTNDEHQVTLGFSAKLEAAPHASPSEPTVLDLFNSDGMCIGFHHWREGDFGPDAVIRTSGDKV